jgi:hypothetical protein
MLPWVWRGDLSDHQAHRYFFVDAHGILRRHPSHGRSWWRLRDEVLAWAQHRRAANTFWGWWWFRREPVGEPCPRRWQCGQREHYQLGLATYHELRYVADARVAPAELRRLDRLDPDLRALVVIDASLLTGPAP